MSYETLPRWLRPFSPLFWLVYLALVSIVGAGMIIWFAVLAIWRTIRWAML